MTVCNATAPMLIFHTATPMMAAKTHANGSALLAGQLNATINTTVTMIGMKASIAYITYTSLRFFICKTIESSELLSEQRAVPDSSLFVSLCRVQQIRMLFNDKQIILSLKN